MTTHRERLLAELRAARDNAAVVYGERSSTFWFIADAIAAEERRAPASAPAQPDATAANEQPQPAYPVGVPGEGPVAPPGS